MVFKKKKVSQRRKHVRENITAEKYARVSRIATGSAPVSVFILAVFAVLTTALLSLDTAGEHFLSPASPLFRPWPKIIAMGILVSVICVGAALYVRNFQPRVYKRPTRTLALAGLFLFLLMITRIGSFLQEWVFLATGAAVTSAIILTIAYNQRFALGLTLFYSILACFAAGTDQAQEGIETIELLLTMMAGVLTTTFALREIRTRMKLIEVSTFASVVVFLTAVVMGVIHKSENVQLFSVEGGRIFGNAGSAAAITIAVGVIIQGFLPIIEKIFGIATSMTLMDYSDANQPLLRKLAMDAPGTFSHSLLIGSIAETAAEAIGANGLLCRVGSYYHDIGKINKSTYFIENQMGSSSRHDQLSPAMSQLVIVGHVKDGIEIAKEFGLPAVLRQFIETHHGTTLIQYFYNEAKKKQQETGQAVSESEFRYPGPKPQTREAAIVMLSDTCESAVRSLGEMTPNKIETVVHNMAMKRLQDGQFDECDLTLKELSLIEKSLSKSLAAHHHGRIAYPTAPDEPESAEQPQAAKVTKSISSHAS